MAWGGGPGGTLGSPIIPINRNIYIFVVFTFYLSKFLNKNFHIALKSSKNIVNIIFIHFYSILYKISFYTATVECQVFTGSFYANMELFLR